LFSWGPKKETKPTPRPGDIAPEKKVAHVTEITTPPNVVQATEAIAKKPFRKPGLMDRVLDLDSLENGLTRLSSQIVDIQRSLTTLRTELQGTNENIDEIEQPVRDLKAPVDQVGEAVDKVHTRLSLVSDQIDQIHEPVSSLVEPLDQMQQQLKLLRGQLVTLESSVGKLELSQLQARVTTLNGDVAKLHTTLKGLVWALGALAAVIPLAAIVLVSVLR
jgi:peptidoglycan hydrolase CwlO-like protein